MRIDQEEYKVEFKEKGKKVKLIVSKGGHLIAQLQLVGKWEEKDAIYLVENEEEVNSIKAIWKINKIWNHMSKEQMLNIFQEHISNTLNPKGIKALYSIRYTTRQTTHIKICSQHQVK